MAGAAVAALLAWCGASLIVLADGPRGMAVGVGLASAGLAALALLTAGVFAAVAIVAGGGLVAFQQVRSGRPGAWGIMPAGSTPRLILCIASGLVALWFALSVTQGSGASQRFAVLVVVTLTVGRILTGKDASVVMAAAAVLALAIGEAAFLSTNSSWPALFAAVVAAGLTFIPIPKPNVT
jgi:hypothetical protein